MCSSLPLSDHMKQEFDVFVGMKEKWLGDLERISQAAATIEADSAAIAEQQAELERVRCAWAFDLCCVVLCFVCCECPCDWMAQTQTAPPFPLPHRLFFGSLFLWFFVSPVCVACACFFTSATCVCSGRPNCACAKRRCTSSSTATRLSASHHSSPTRPITKPCSPSSPPRCQRGTGLCSRSLRGCRCWVMAWPSMQSDFASRRSMATCLSSLRTLPFRTSLA